MNPAYTEGNRIAFNIPFCHTQDGAITGKTRGTETTSHSYDGLDRLATPTTTVDYAYDPLGRRIQRSEGNDITNYHFYRDTDLIDYRTDETGTLTAASLRGAGGLISETDHTTPSPETDYYLFSPHGDNTGVLKNHGAKSA